MLKNDLDNKLDLSEMIDSEIREIIRENFIYEISEFLTKKEKISLREISKSFEKDVFSQIRINVFLKKSSEVEDFNNFNLDLKKILKFYQNMERLRIESIRLNEKNIEILEEIMKQNIKSLKILHLMNIEYEQFNYLERLYYIVNNLSNLTEISFGGIGNRDRLVLHIEKNNKKLSFKDNIKVLKIDNLPLCQIKFLLSYFDQYNEISIENCSLDEDLALLTQKLIDKKLTKINLPLNGFSSNIAFENIKTILNHQEHITEISLKGIWFKSINSLYTEFQLMNNLEKLDLSGSKHIFSETGMDSTIIFKYMKSLKIIDLSDSRMRTSNLENLLKNMNPKISESLEEIILMKNLLSYDCFEIMNSYAEKIRNLKVLKIGFNPQIANRGFHIFAHNCEKFNINYIDFRGCAINLKQAMDDFHTIIFKKSHGLNKIDFYSNTFRDADFEVFVKSIYNNLLSSYDKNVPINMKMFFKFKCNLELHKKLEMELDFLYKAFNVVIR